VCSSDLRGENLQKYQQAWAEDLPNLPQNLELKYDEEKQSLGLKENNGLIPVRRFCALDKLKHQFTGIHIK
jgi:hypothetical protein